MEKNRPSLRCLPWLLLLLSLQGQCQELFVAGVPPHFAWGAYNKGETDGFCYLANKSALARCTEPVAGLLAERPFNIASLGRYRFSLVMPVKHGAVGLQGGFVSAPPYRELLAALAYGRRLGNLLDLGVQFGYSRAAVPGYPPVSIVTADMGLVMHLTGQVDAGWNLSIPYGMQGLPGASPLPLHYSMGVGYNPGPSWSAALEISRQPAAGTNATLGFIYRPHSRVLVKMGFSTAGPPLWFGVGYQLRRLRVDLSSSVHERLGFSPCFGMLINLKNRK